MQYIKREKNVAVMWMNMKTMRPRIRIRFFSRLLSAAMRVSSGGPDS